jgi:hypothetical protein
MALFPAAPVQRSQPFPLTGEGNLANNRGPGRNAGSRFPDLHPVGRRVHHACADGQGGGEPCVPQPPSNSVADRAASEIRVHGMYHSTASAPARCSRSCSRRRRGSACMSSSRNRMVSPRARIAPRAPGAPLQPRVPGAARAEDNADAWALRGEAVTTSRFSGRRWSRRRWSWCSCDDRVASEPFDSSKEAVVEADRRLPA